MAHSCHRDVADESRDHPRCSWPQRPRTRSCRKARPPDQRWRLRVQRDARAESAHPALRPPPLPASSELNATDALPAYRAVAGRHRRSPPAIRESRQIVFQSNFGLIRCPGRDDAHAATRARPQDAPESAGRSQCMKCRSPARTRRRRSSGAPEALRCPADGRRQK
jgi:hypothetical protein